MGNVTNHSIRKPVRTDQVVFDDELREHIITESGGTNFYLGSTEWSSNMMQRCLDDFDPKKNKIYQVDVMFDMIGAIKRIRILFGCSLSNKSYEMINRPKRLKLVSQDRKEFDVEFKEFGSEEKMRRLFFK